MRDDPCGRTLGAVGVAGRSARAGRVVVTRTLRASRTVGVCDGRSVRAGTLGCTQDARCGRRRPVAPDDSDVVVRGRSVRAGRSPYAGRSARAVAIGGTLGAFTVATGRSVRAGRSP